MHCDLRIAGAMNEKRRLGAAPLGLSIKNDHQETRPKVFSRLLQKMVGWKGKALVVPCRGRNSMFLPKRRRGIPCPFGM